MTSITLRKASSSSRRARLAPAADPARDPTASTRARFQGTYPRRASFPTDRAVPMAELSLLVPMATWAGSPAIR